MYTLIERGIKPVCDALNSFEAVVTTHSCEGHPSVPLRPFVSFRAPREFAYLIHKLLGIGHGDGTLKFCWHLIARFDDDMNMTYTITPNDVRIPGGGWFVFKKWGRKSMDEELLRLSILLQKIISDGEVKTF